MAICGFNVGAVSNHLPPGARKTGHGNDVAMLIEDFFEAVDRAFVEEARRIPAPLRLELKSPVELPLSVPQISPSTPLSERRRLERRLLPERRLPRE